MALEQRYETAFRQECNGLSQMVMGSLLKLASKPREKQELQKLVQSADTIMGNARFLEDKELEETATQVVHTFGKTADVRKKIDEYTAALDQFSRLLDKNGIPPRGYKIINGHCVLECKITSRRVNRISYNIHYFEQE